MDDQVDDLPHAGLGGRTVLALQTTGEGDDALQTSLFSLHVVLADTSSKPYVACATSWFALHGNRRWPGPSQPIFRLIHARLEFPGHSRRL